MEAVRNPNEDPTDKDSVHIQPPEEQLDWRPLRLPAGGVGETILSSRSVDLTTSWAAQALAIALAIAAQELLMAPPQSQDAAGHPREQGHGRAATGQGLGMASQKLVPVAHSH